MTRSELVQRVAERAAMSPADADAAVKVSLAGLARALTKDWTARLAGFGTLAAKHRPARSGRGQ